ncbi:6977_t:CDS:1 [Entrophospora sp. SA101]|nr:6977_t:CDS:1 [Entrophospora sp. SA101]CAJ0916210.1 10028_t:CDS:1 [Entrophospora sp. SA101]
MDPNTSTGVSPSSIIVGIVIGSLVGLSIIIGLLWFLNKKRRQNFQESSNNGNFEEKQEKPRSIITTSNNDETNSITKPKKTKVKSDKPPFLTLPKLTRPLSESSSIKVLLINPDEKDKDKSFSFEDYFKIIKEKREKKDKKKKLEKEKK